VGKCLCTNRTNLMISSRCDIGRITQRTPRQKSRRACTSETRELLGGDLDLDSGSTPSYSAAVTVAAPTFFQVLGHVNGVTIERDAGRRSQRVHHVSFAHRAEQTTVRAGASGDAETLCSMIARCASAASRLAASRESRDLRIDDAWDSVFELAFIAAPEGSRKLRA